jgi:hypothetical protein
MVAYPQVDTGHPCLAGLATASQLRICHGCTSAWLGTAAQLTNKRYAECWGGLDHWNLGVGINMEGEVRRTPPLEAASDQAGESN